jgi:chromosome segregation ATPase
VLSSVALQRQEQEEETAAQLQERNEKITVLDAALAEYKTTVDRLSHDVDMLRKEKQRIEASLEMAQDDNQVLLEQVSQYAPPESMH